MVGLRGAPSVRSLAAPPRLHVHVTEKDSKKSCETRVVNAGLAQADINVIEVAEL
jgi:hypothetical protein